MHPGAFERLKAESTLEFARIPEATGIFGISRTRLYREAALGNIKLVKLGNATLVDVASLRAFMSGLPGAVLRARRSPPETQPPARVMDRRRDRMGMSAATASYSIAATDASAGSAWNASCISLPQ